MGLSVLESQKQDADARYPLSHSLLKTQERDVKYETATRLESSVRSRAFGELMVGGSWWSRKESDGYLQTNDEPMRAERLCSTVNVQSHQCSKRLTRSRNQMKFKRLASGPIDLSV